MAYNTKPIVTDKDGNPISQYYNPNLDQYEAVEGSNGANKVIVYKSDGTENTDISLLPILEKLNQLTGTIIDEETRKSNEIVRQDNEIDRVELYNELLIQLTRISQIEQQVPEEVVNNLNSLTTYVNGLAGIGRTTETVKGNADNIQTVADDLDEHKADNTNAHGINNKADKISPIMYEVANGFASGWSGNIKYGKTQENMLIVIIPSLVKSSEIGANETVYTLPAGFRPANNSKTHIAGATAVNTILGSIIEIQILATGVIRIKNLGSVTTGVVNVEGAVLISPM